MINFIYKCLVVTTVIIIVSYVTLIFGIASIL